MVAESVVFVNVLDEVKDVSVVTRRFLAPDHFNIRFQFEDLESVLNLALNFLLLDFDFGKFGFTWGRWCFLGGTLVSAFAGGSSFDNCSASHGQHSGNGKNHDMFGNVVGF